LFVSSRGTANDAQRAEAVVGINVNDIPEPHHLAERGR
jgi:hypothetical protein